MQEFKPFKEGKVREVYDNGDSLIIVATDRISAFDNILKNRITDKGAILTQMSKFWFDFTKDVVPNHMISVFCPLSDGTHVETQQCMAVHSGGREG